MTEQERKIKTPNEKAQTTQLSLEQYKSLKEQKAKKQAKAFRLPATVKWILAIPLLLIFLFGIFYVPYLLITAASNPPPATTQKNK